MIHHPVGAADSVFLGGKCGAFKTGGEMARRFLVCRPEASGDTSWAFKNTT
jgi:hypothetical protein